VRILIILAATGLLVSAQTPKLPADVDPGSYSRLPLLKRDQMTPEQVRVLDKIAGKDKNSGQMGPQATSMYSAGVAEPVNELNQYLRKTVIGPQFFEIGALLGARDQDQAYEWSAHEVAAQRVGVDQKVIDTIKFNRDPAGLPEKEATAIRFGRGLLKEHKASSELYAKMVELFGKQGMYEFTSVMSDYVMVAIMLNAVDQQLPPERKPLLPPK
jgi:hypothetical protein